MTTVNRRLVAGTVPMLAVWAMVGCASTPTQPTVADSRFVIEMSIDASTTMALADVARQRGTRPEVRAFAAAAHATAAPVVDALTALGPALAADGAPGFAHSDETDHDHAGTDATQTLRESKELGFDAAFLALIRTELDAGLDLARQSKDTLKDPRTSAMAERVMAEWPELQARAEALAR